MKRNLITQMRREWSGNLWLVIELIIVGTVIWTIFTSLLPLLRRGMAPHGYDITDVYTATVKSRPESSPSYQPFDSVSHTPGGDIQRLMTQLRTNPYVELAGRGVDCCPYTMNYRGSWVIDADSCNFDSGEVVRTYITCRYMTPEVARILRLEGTEGETPEQIAGALERGEVVLCAPDRRVTPQDKNLRQPEDMRGRSIYWELDTTRRYTVGNLTARNLLRSDYDVITDGDGIRPLRDGEVGRTVVVRVKPGTGQEFLQSLTLDQTSAGNYYLTGWSSLESAREIISGAIHTMRRNQIMFTVILLAVVFMGFLGTFWFRTQQRTGEIAMRKVCGATDSQIFVRMLTEALALLGMALIPTAALCYLIYARLMVKPDVSPEASNLFYGYHDWALWVSSAATVLLMVLVIVAALWFPARKAMKVDPAAALKDL